MIGLQSLAHVLTLASWRADNPPWLMELLAAVGDVLPKRKPIPSNALVISETDSNL
jgi:hypothetical protein